jgi:MFS family permease
LRVAALYPSLAVPSVRLFWIGMVPSIFAFQMSVVAGGYAAVTLSKSALAVGLVGGAWGLPLLIVPLIGGVAADRYSRRTIALAAHVLMGLGSIILGVLALGHVLQVWHLVALGLVQGVAYGCLTPARVAYIADALPDSLMPNAIAAHYASANVITVTGPTVAGFLLAIPSVGIGSTYIAITVLYVVVLTILLRLPDTASGQRSVATSGLDRAREGLRYVRSTPPLPALLAFAAVVTLFGLPYLQLLPLFSDRVFFVGPAGLGLLFAAGGVGAVIGSTLVGLARGHRRLSLYQSLAGIGLGASLIAFSLSPVFPLALLAAGFAGAAASAFTIVNNALVLTRADPQMYGRVASIHQLTFGLGPLGTLPMAGLADRIGPAAAVGLGGAVVFLAAVVAAARGRLSRSSSDQVADVRREGET